MLTRRHILWSCSGAALSLIVPAAPSFAAGETTALIKLVRSAKSNDFSTIDSVAESARKIGWTVPTKGSQMALLGNWNFITSKSEKGELIIQKGGKLAYGSGTGLPFKSWEVRSNGSRPALLVLKTGTTDVWFQYFQRPGVALISNLGNRSQWIVMTAK